MPPSCFQPSLTLPNSPSPMVLPSMYSPNLVCFSRLLKSCLLRPPRRVSSPCCSVLATTGGAAVLSSGFSVGCGCASTSRARDRSMSTSGCDTSMLFKISLASLEGPWGVDDEVCCDLMGNEVEPLAARESLWLPLLLALCDCS